MQYRHTDVSTTDTVSILSVHVLAFLLTAVYFIRSVILRQTRLNDYVAITAASFELLLLFEALYTGRCPIRILEHTFTHITTSLSLCQQLVQ